MDELKQSVLNLERLRSEFDDAFALPAANRLEGPASFVAIDIGAERYAIGIDELARVEPVRDITFLPDARPELLGIVGIGGRVIPIYSLPALLGATGHQPDSNRWVAVWKYHQPLGIAFTHLSGLLRVSQDQVIDASDKSREMGIEKMLVTSGGMRLILRSKNIIDSIERGLGVKAARE